MMTSIRSRMFVATSIVLLGALAGVESNSAGANTKVCNSADMKPEHSGSDGFVTTGSNFTVTVLESEYIAGGPPLTVKITGGSFRGFIIQARKPNSYDRLAKGKIQGPPPLTNPVCGVTGNGLTHTRAFSSRINSEISMSWKPPSVCEALEVGDVVFQATVVIAYTQKPHINLFSQVVPMKSIESSNLTAEAEACRQAAANGSQQTAPSFHLIGWTMAMVISTALVIQGSQ